MTALFSSRKRARLSNSDMRDDTNTSPPEEKLNSIAESNVSVDDLVTQPIEHEKKFNKKKKEVANNEFRKHHKHKKSKKYKKDQNEMKSVLKVKIKSPVQVIEGNSTDHQDLGLVSDESTVPSDDVGSDNGSEV